MLDPARIEELRAIAILANDRVKRREADQAPPATTAFFNARHVQSVEAFHDSSREVLIEILPLRRAWVTRLEVGVGRTS